MPSLKLLADRGQPTDQYRLPAEKRLAGDPLQSLWLDYEDGSGVFAVGHWHSEVGKWRVSYTEEEYCQILEGVSLVTDDQGHPTRLEPGSSFVVPRGFQGTWEVVEPTLKRFVVYEAKGG
ncbi:cupin domain-containing protein [Pseudomonas oryzihabitans]|uniref:cupin domain-containing protein n=1 Tax=Pseudomonas oryzihabitans TaxID=47885 RepID=UPI00214E7A1E|nr:cupin domain-containing protein [Pseudomonas psychrotolerans]UUW70917.1 cupin domain-containing protein [Pseudomonas psychrotolerans]